jgi:hypothetical protein
MNPQAPQNGQNSQTNPNSTQNTLQIAEIRDGVVIMNDGSFRCVIILKSINYDLMSQQEQESVEYAYQSFLNSLYFPVQIFLRSAKVDLQPYIEKLDKIRTEHDNMLLALLMDDYIGVQAALSGLRQCGVQGLPLDTSELIELYYDTYNPDTAARQQLKNYDDLDTDIITRGQGNAPQPHLQRELQ